MARKPRLKVLLVNDELVLCRALSRVLAGAGHDALTAESGVQALEILGRERVDLLVTDSTMPGMHGLELLERVRRDFPELPAFLTTAVCGPEYATRLARLGFPPPVLLPVGHEEFVGYVERATFR